MVERRRRLKKIFDKLTGKGTIMSTYRVNRDELVFYVKEDSQIPEMFCEWAGTTSTGSCRRLLLP